MYTSNRHPHQPCSPHANKIIELSIMVQHMQNAGPRQYNTLIRMKSSRTKDYILAAPNHVNFLSEPTMIKDRKPLDTHTTKPITLPRKKCTLRVGNRVPSQTRQRVRVYLSRRKTRHRIPSKTQLSIGVNRGRRKPLCRIPSRTLLRIRISRRRRKPLRRIPHLVPLLRLMP